MVGLMIPGTRTDLIGAGLLFIAVLYYRFLCRRGVGAVRYLLLSLCSLPCQLRSFWSFKPPRGSEAPEARIFQRAGV